jgi:TRAP-type C4-dicarboxylate transport system substrate-binding protein
VRAQLQAAMDEATAYGNAISAAENAASLESIRKAGHTRIISLTPAEQAEWRKALVYHGLSHIDSDENARSPASPSESRYARWT